MRETILKNQIVVFGQFNFPPIPEVTLSLMQSFMRFALMPQVVHQIDANGQMQPKMALIKDDATQIIFSSDRIDFIQTIPKDDTNIEGFYDEVREYLGCLQSRNLTFNRLALVSDRLVHDLTGEQKERLREQYSDRAPVNAIEWGFRWVNPELIDGQLLNISLDCSRQQGVLNANGKVEQFDGVKILHDIGHNPSNASPRFNVENVSEGFSLLLNVMRQKSAEFKPNL